MRNPHKPGQYYKTCRFHGSLGWVGPVEHKTINDRRMSPRQWKRYERKWKERGEAYDREHQAEQAPVRPLKPLYEA